MHLGTISYLFTLGKNRKQRTVPLTNQTVKVLTAWLKERHGQPEDPLFPSNRGRPPQPRRGRMADRQTHHHRRRALPDTPHQERHRPRPAAHHRDDAAAIRDQHLCDRALARPRTRTTTRGYLHGDLRLKQRALDRTTPPDTKPGRYRATDSLLAFLDNL